LLVDRASRRWLGTRWPWLAIGIGLLFLMPPIVWNVKHDWVTFKHVAKQTGASQGAVFNGNFVEFVGSQLGVVGLALVPFMVGGILYAWRRQRALGREPSPQPSPGVPGDGVSPERAVVFLMWMGLPLFVMCLIGSIRSKMQVNWPAAAYFSWMILTAHFIATRLADRAKWRRWRGWFWGAVVFGVAMMPVAHNFEVLYPPIARYNAWLAKRGKKLLEFRQADPTAKLKGWKELGARVTREMKGLNNPFVLCEDYMQTAEMAFYVEHNPKTFCLGPYIEKLDDRKRRTQYDVWPDRDLSQSGLRGRDAIYVGYIHDDVLKGFARVEELPDEEIYRRGQKVRRFKVYRCRDFKGLTIQEPGGAF
jgi:hypothetical protein